MKDKENRLNPLPAAELGAQLTGAIPALRPIVESYQAGSRAQARGSLLSYFQNRKHPLHRERDESVSVDVDGIVKKAHGLATHSFDMGFTQPPHDMGPDIDWTSNPAGDNEWAARLHRFDWYDHLLSAYEYTGDEKHIRTLVALTEDWIAKNPVYTPHVSGILPWLDIQVGVRSQVLAEALPRFIGATSLTPKFLEIFLASVFDNGQKTALYPRLAGHNKTIIEAAGLIALAVAFPEFSSSPKWLDSGIEILESAVDEEVGDEGIHNEWTPSYHLGLAALISRTLKMISTGGREASPTLKRKNELMFRYVLALSSPLRTLPMFGDTKKIDLAPAFVQSTELFGDPVFRAVGEEQSQDYPDYLSRSFPASGMYVMRSGWDRDAVHLALHCSPPSRGTHNQPDNGTFELHAYGTCLTPDSGSYAYPNTPHADEREWFRRTAVHQTLTLGGKDSTSAPVHRIWTTLESCDVLVVDNQSYPELLHRRTVFFVERRFFVLVDEGIYTKAPKGDDAVELHFQFAPGPVKVEPLAGRAYSNFPHGSNLLIWQPSSPTVDLAEEPGQVSYRLNEKKPRTAIAYRHRSEGSALFSTVLVPYRGNAPPRVTASPILEDGSSGSHDSHGEVGVSALKISVSLNETTWRLTRDLDSGSASCTRLE